MTERALQLLQEAIQRQQAEQTIDLDCPPGDPRPGDLYPGVIADTGLPSREPVSKFFGNWHWDYSDVSAEEWTKVRETIKPRIIALYNAGKIRYGSW